MAKKQNSITWEQFRQIAKEDDDALQQLFATWERVEELKLKNKQRQKKWRQKQKEKQNVRKKRKTT